MKVVLFCGGLGMRIREYSEKIPKPMIEIGNKPILWQIMRYYAHFGHKDFILCLGYKAEMIKDYFLNFNEAISNDFIHSRGSNNIKKLNKDIQDWKITFVDTGLHCNIGERLVAVKDFLKDEDVFLANYSDVLTDLNLPDMIHFFRKKDKVVCLLGVKSAHSFHLVDIQNDGIVRKIRIMSRSNLRVNGGFYIFKKQVFDYIKNGEELISEPFERLIQMEELSAYVYDGFFRTMDTFKEKQFLEDMYTKGETPWQVWKRKSAIHLNVDKI